MNDFTKEELQEVLRCSTHLAGCDPALIRKIKFLIDNYCNHEQCGDGAGFEQVCFECDKSSKERKLIHDLENLWNYLHGAHSVCDHDNSSATFHQACHMVMDIINRIKSNE